MLGRRTLVFLLAIATLSMASWAPACDLSCSLAPLHSGCHLAHGGISKRKTPPGYTASAHSHCGHVARNPATPAFAGPSADFLNSRTQNPCMHTAALVTAVSDSSPERLDAADRAAFATVHFVTLFTPILHSESESSSRQNHAFSFSLRI
jgi:hypothetical protein